MTFTIPGVFIRYSKSGIPVHHDSTHSNTASIYNGIPEHILVGNNFYLLDDDEKEFILAHEEGHTVHGHSPANVSAKALLELEHKCDRYALERSDLKAGLGAIDKMIANSAGNKGLIDHLNQRKILLMNC